ncbi:hypothetical protein [Campylobacter gastrosuis]|uniref:Uncharacterized protein n=1 Tax=Campylobacter gastrosuis TaxID=2974576 RepID=A0ABT7HU99_9BACT|nr:hypothetical protein [Campylobacter gastrosuis]MDL0090023.1 hypothetical protein [Campylobacter gastrosuis]
MDFLGGLSSLGSAIGNGLKSGWEWLKGTDNNGTSNALTALGTLGALYNGYEQNKMAKKNFALQKDAYDFNKMLSQRELQKENRAQQNLENAWANSALSKAFKDARLKDDEEEQ